MEAGRLPEGDKRILVAAPRGWCAGVERAVEVVEQALDRHGPPIYVRKQIVHNRHVVEALEQKGAVFVDTEEDVPEGSVCVFSAHGVSPLVRENAERRHLSVIDATCPLVTKVHVEARRFAQQRSTIVLIGHVGHEEIEGTSGEAPERTIVVERTEEVESIVVPDPQRVSYLTQTTLAVDEANKVVAALRQRFPDLKGPSRNDICYATQNRQAAVTAIAMRADLVFIVGDKNSSNSNRLVEVARNAGTTAYLIQDEHGIDASLVRAATTIGISSGASTPDHLVMRVIATLGEMGVEDVEEVKVAEEKVSFPLPPLPE